MQTSFFVIFILVSRDYAGNVASLVLLTRAVFDFSFFGGISNKYLV